MTFSPSDPFPKVKGDGIRSQDWNALVEEVQRLGSDKMGKVGDAIEGDLTVSGAVGIGTDAPAEALDVHGAVCFEGDTNRRVYGAARGGRDTVVVDAHWDEMEIKGRAIDWTGTHFYIGLENAHPNGYVHIGRQCAGTVLYSGGARIQTLMATNDRVGVGTNAPRHKLHVVGDRIRLQKANTSQTLDMSTHGSGLDIMSTGADLYMNNGSGRSVRIRKFVNISSRAYKDDIGHLSTEAAEEILDGLAPVAFRFKDDEQRKENLGFIAEDVPDTVATADKEGIDPMAITAVLTKMVKQQQDTIGELRRELAGLKAIILGRDAEAAG